MFADKLILGAGMHRFEKSHLDAYRRAVLDPRKGPALVSAIGKVNSAGLYEIGGATRKQAPRGFDAGHARAALLLHDGLWGGFEGTIPAEARSAAFVDFCAGHFRAVFPVHRWLLGLRAGV